MYSGPNPEVLEMLFLRALEDLHCLRSLTGKADGALSFIVKSAKKHKIRCGNTTVYCSKRDITLEEMATILHDAWKLCDEAWPMEEE
jgi:hypothetical protein